MYRRRLDLLISSAAATWHASGTVRSEGEDCLVSGEMPLRPADGFGGWGQVWGELILDLQQHTYNALISGHDPDATIYLDCPRGTFETEWHQGAIMNTAFHDTHLSVWIEMTDDGRLDSVHVDPGYYAGARWEWHFDPAPPSTGELP